jgi:two-component system, chemotaxis family, chemotaxis protein CheV
MMLKQEQILLTPGTNEVEVLEISVGGYNFGINVLKVRQMVQFDSQNLTRLAHSHEAVRGAFLLRGEAVVMIDLEMYLYGKETEPGEDRPAVVVVCEFNGMTFGFLTEKLNQIYRVSWEALQTTPTGMNSDGPPVISGIVADVAEHDIMILNLEDLIEDIVGSALFAEPDLVEEGELSDELQRQRGLVDVVVAEDSHTVRRHLTSVLHSAGYERLHIYENGEDAYLDLTKRIKLGSCDNLLVVTDIEMPRMDGLTLCRRIKEQSANISVIVLSSMLSSQIAEKCKQVGADDSLSKENVNRLVERMDQLCLSPA